jgi:hypothetical protein
MRFMMLVKHGENPGPPPKEFVEAMMKLDEEAVKSGAMVQSGGLSAIAKSTRVRLSRGQVTAIDGPFTESKEVVGGFAILRANSKAEVIELTKKFLSVAGPGECEIRQIYEAGQGWCAANS